MFCINEDINKEDESKNTEEDQENEQTNLSQIKKKVKKKSKKEISQKTPQQSLTIKYLEAGDIISYKELKYYSSTAICSQGTTVLKIGIQQTSNLKLYGIWQDYFYDYNGEQNPQCQTYININNQFEQNYDKYIQKYKFIKLIPLFKTISTDIIDQTFNLAIYSQGDYIYKEFDFPKFIYIIFEGEVEILMSNTMSNHSTISRSPSLSPKKNTSPRKQNPYIKTSILSTGNIFGEEEIITQSLRSFTARTISKRLLLYQLPIFLFLDHICRQNEEFLDKLKLKIQNKQYWRDSQISSIQKVQIKLNQLDSSSKLNIPQLNNNLNNQLIQHSSEISINKKTQQDIGLGQQNLNGNLYKRSSSHLRNEISPLKKHPKIVSNPFSIPQYLESGHLDENKSMIKEIDDKIYINLGKKSQQKNANEKSNQMDQEESTIKRQVTIKQNVLNMIKKNNTISINNQQFPSFEKPLIPITDGVGLGVKNTNKYLMSSNRQSRNSSQPSIDQQPSSENLNSEQINNKIKSKLYQNIQSSNQNFISHQSNIDKIEFEVQKDEMKINKIANSLYQQSLQQQIQNKQQKQQHNLQIYQNTKSNFNPQINSHVKHNVSSISNSNVNSSTHVNSNSNSHVNSHVVSRRSSKQLKKELNRSMDDIYAQVDKSSIMNKMSSRNIMDNETSRINSFRNPYLNDENQDISQKDQAVDLSLSQIGTQIDRNLRVNSKIGNYFRINKSYLLHKADLKEKSNKGEQKVNEIQTKQDSQNNMFQQNQSVIPINELNSIYQSLEKYRQLEDSPQKVYIKRNLSIKDKRTNKQNELIENNTSSQIGKLNTSRDQYQIKNPIPKYLNSVSKLTPQISQNLLNNEKQEIIGIQTERYNFESKQRESKSQISHVQHKKSCECKLCSHNRKNSLSNNNRLSVQENKSNLLHSKKRIKTAKRVIQLTDGNSHLDNLLKK